MAQNKSVGAGICSSGKVDLQEYVHTKLWTYFLLFGK